MPAHIITQKKKSEIWIFPFVTSAWSQQTDQHNVYKANLML